MKVELMMQIDTIDVFSFTELTKKSGHPRHGIIKSMKKRMTAVMYALVE